jgi:heavy metal sensor kinase
MFRSIRVRLALSYTLLVAITFLLIAWAIYEYINSSLATALDQSIVKEMDWVKARYEKRLARSDPAQITREDFFEHASFFPLKEYVEVWDASDSIFYRSPNLEQDTLAHFATIPKKNEGTFETVTFFRNHEIRLAVQKTPYATVLVAMPTESITKPVRQLLRILLWLGPIVIVVAIGAGSYLAKKSFSKINQVIETANMITADRLHDRIPEHNAKDEVGKIISTFNEMISRLDVSFQQVKQFSADASHELRTPLSVMRTQLETALNANVSLDDLKTIAANCLDETMRMATIIDNLLLLARADAEQDVIEREPVDLKKLVHETYDESIIIASQKDITVTLRNTDEAMIVGDEQRLRQMLLNLIDNAIKYNRNNGRIDIGLSRENGAGRIYISDTGIGIPDSEIPRIFDRFYRVDRARSRALGGTGLGLSIVHWIVKAHGGSIHVKSKLGQGTEFSVTIPLRQNA